jgi:hypothetical protein
MIGGMAGGLIDPDTLQGAEYSGRSIAGSESGLARAIIWGTKDVEGRLMDGEDKPRIGTRTESAGKGGAEIEHDTALLSYAIEICESSQLRGTLVQGVHAVWEDEKLVYDVREGSLVSPADNAKWIRNKKFWFGEEGQLPSAMLQSIHGVGNVPAYVGTCRMDVDSEDLVLHGERVPKYRFLVSQCAVEPPNHLLVTGSSIDEGGPCFTTARVTEPLEFEGIEQSTGADIQGATCAYWPSPPTWVAVGDHVGRISTDNRKTWQSIDVDRASNGILVPGPDGWIIAAAAGPAGPYDLTAKADPIADGFSSYAFTAPPDFTHGEEAYNFGRTGGKYWADVGAMGYCAEAEELNGTMPVIYARVGYPDCFSAFHDRCQFGIGDTVYAAGIFGVFSYRAQVRRSDDGGETYPHVIVDVATGPYSPLQLQAMVREDGTGVLLCYCLGGAYVWTSEDGFAEPHATGIASDISGVIPISATHGKGRQIVAVNELETFYLISGANDAFPDLADKCVTTKDGITFSAPVPHGVKGAIAIAAAGKFVPTGGGILIPDAPGFEIDPGTGQPIGPDEDIARPCGTFLDIIVRDAHRLGAPQIEESEFELSAIEGIPVLGYSVQELGITAADATEPLRRVFLFDLVEYDAKLRARMRGGPVNWIIDPDEFIKGEENTLEGKRGQDVKYPRELQLAYSSITLDYKPTTQRAEDPNPDIFTVSKESYQTNLVLEDDPAAQNADVMLKVMRTEREKEEKGSLPIKYLGMVPSDILIIEDRRYRIDQMRVERNRIVIERAVSDRPSAYVSDVVGAEGIRRPPPVSSVRGPVASAVMNMPVLRDEDDRAGIYWAGAGYLPGYRGSLLQMSRNGVDFEIGPELLNSSTMGLLTAALPTASRYVQDNTNVLRVKMYPGGKDLDSATFEALMGEANVAAIVYPDGTTEIIQFQTAVETADLEYELTGLMRGRQDTTPGEHLEGAQFVLLDEDVRFVAIRPDDVGKTLTFRAVSRGTNPEDNATQAVTFTTIESLREWQPYNVVVTPNGLGGFCVEWIGRARLGSSRAPAHSQWFEGYRVTFTVGTTTYHVDTTAQAVCVSAETMLEAFGAGHAIPDITVRARSRVATNDDDFDSPPGNPPSEQYPSYPGTIIGEPGDMYEGEGVLDYLGPNNNPPFQAYGGKKEEYFTGYIARNVTCQNSFAPASGRMVGIPLAAGTADADTTLWASGPDVVGGPFTITDSVTVLPMPAFAVMDELNPWGEKPLVTLVTSTPRTTKRIGSSGLGGLRSRAGFSTGQRRCEFTIGDMPAGGRIAIGVLAAGANAHLAPGTGGTFAHIVTGNGTFAVEVDASTGDVEVFELGVGPVASGTLPLTYAHDGKYRFAWVANDATHYAHGATVHTNQGGESWAITASGGFGGVPNEAHVIPCGWDAAVGDANGYWPQGATGTLTLAAAGGFSGTSVIYAYSEFAKSTGDWRIGMGCATNGVARIGLCKAGHTGLLGQGGDSFGMSYDFTVPGSPQLVFDTTWAGQIRIPHPFYTMDRKIIFVCDFDAHTVEVWGKPQFSDYTLLVVLTGLPSGSWVPAGNHAVELINGASEAPGATDWSVTKTP